MNFLPSRLTARHAYGVLAVLLFAHCANAYWKSLPRQMAKFANWHMELTVEEVPQWIFAGQFLFGEADRFDYRFALSRGDKLCTSFVIHGGDSSRYMKAEVLKPDPILDGDKSGDGDEDARVNLVCAMDGALRVICRGELYQQIHWSTNGGGGPALKKTGPRTMSRRRFSLTRARCAGRRRRRRCTSIFCWSRLAIGRRRRSRAMRFMT